MFENSINRSYVPKVVLLIICLIFSFSGCAKDTTTYLYIPLKTVPTCFDPQIASGEDLETIINNCFEGLVRIDKSGNIVNALAESYEVSEDGLTYTFKLREDSTYRVPKSAEDIDNRVTAHDFVFAIERALDPNTASPYAASLSIIESINASDDYTLVITLAHPSESFLTTLASPVCMPCNEEFFNSTSGRYGLNASLILSNGPYYISSYDEEAGTITLTSNSTYTGDCTPLANSIKFSLPSDNSEVTYDIETYNSTESDSISKSLTVEKYKNTVYAFCINAKSPVLQSSAIRKELCSATDTSIFTTKELSAAEGIVPSCCNLIAGSSYRANINIVKGADYSVSTALSNFLLTAEEEEITSINIKLICLKSDEQNVKKVVQDWQQVFGTVLSVTIETYEEVADLEAAVEKGNFDIAYTGIKATSFIASDFLSRFVTGSGGNIISLASEEYDKLVKNIYTASSKEELIEASKNAEGFLLTEGYIIPTVTVDTYVAKTTNGAEISLRPSGTVMSFYK